MRINKFVAQATGLSRRAADQAISSGRVTVNGQAARLGDEIDSSAVVRLDQRVLKFPSTTMTIMLNKPVGYVCSRDGQGSLTVYDLLPAEYQSLKPVGRLDKDSSGLLLLTDDGQLANELTHPRYGKEKVYTVKLDKPLVPEHQAELEQGVTLEDGPSHLQISKTEGTRMEVHMSEGRNRQIRRTFAALGYNVIALHRTAFGQYRLENLPAGEHRHITS